MSKQKYTHQITCVSCLDTIFIGQYDTYRLADGWKLGVNNRWGDGICPKCDKILKAQITKMHMMNYHITDKEHTINTICDYLWRQNEFIIHIDDDSDICSNIKISDIIFKNDQYICVALSSVGEDGFVKIIVKEMTNDKNQD